MALELRASRFDQENVPAGGVCLSSFVLVVNGGRILVGKMVQPEIWVKRFFVGERFAPTYATSGKYLIPAQHLAWYQSPLEAAERIVTNQVGLPSLKKSIRLLEVQSHLRGEVGSAERPAHWDLCFVYQAKAPAGVVRGLKTPAWFDDLHFAEISSLSVNDFTRGHGDVLEEAGLLSKKRASS